MTRFPTTPIQRLFMLLAWGLVALGAASPGMAAEPYSYTLGLLGGVGGPVEGDTDVGLGNQTLQLNVGFVSSSRTHIVTRLGQTELDDESGFAGLFRADLTYLTVGGEYRYLEPLYDSGIFLGLGAYRLAGRAGGESREETAVGLHFGVTADFPLDPNWSLVAELTGHWADFDESQLFGNAVFGVAYHF